MNAPSATASAQSRMQRQSRSELATIIRGVARDPLGLIGLAIVGIIVERALLATWIVPYDPNALNVKDRLQGPSFLHLLGTDQLGRDTFSRMVMGGRVALQVALPAVGRRAMVIGLTLGMIAGYGPRWLDNASSC